MVTKFGDGEGDLKGALGMAVSCWAAGQGKLAVDFALYIDVSDDVKDPGVRAAARNIYNAAQQ